MKSILILIAGLIGLSAYSENQLRLFSPQINAVSSPMSPCYGTSWKFFVSPYHDIDFGVETKVYKYYPLLHMWSTPMFRMFSYSGGGASHDLTGVSPGLYMAICTTLDSDWAVDWNSGGQGPTDFLHMVGTQGSGCYTYWGGVPPNCAYWFAYLIWIDPYNACFTQISLYDYGFDAHVPDPYEIY